MFEPSPCEKNGKSGKSHAACSSLGAHQKQAQPQTPLAMKGEQRRCILQPASQWSSWHKKNTCSESLKLRDTPKYLQNISKISPKCPKIRNCSMFPRESLPSTPVTNSTCRHGSRSILTPGRWAHMVGLVKFSFGCVGFQILYVPCCLSNQIQVGGSYNLGIVSSFQASVIENALLQFGISQTNFATLETWYRGPTMWLTMSLLTFKWNRV